MSDSDSDQNYVEAGTLVDEPEDEISLTKYHHLLKDEIHSKIMEVLEETNLPFKLADFQLLSLHVLGSKQNLVLLSPTGSGKLLGKLIILYNTIWLYNRFLESFMIKQAGAELGQAHFQLREAFQTKKRGNLGNGPKWR